MSIYSSTEVYPEEYDMDLTTCQNCGFPCDEFEYCKLPAIDDPDSQDQYLHDLLKSKGYGGCCLKLEEIKGKNWLVLYVFNAPYLFAEKCNVELGVPVVPVKTELTMSVPGLNISNVYTQFLAKIDQISCRDEPVNESNIIGVEDMFKYINEHFHDTVEHCMEINITRPEEIINVVDAFNNLDLTMIMDTSTGELLGYVSEEVIL